MGLRTLSLCSGVGGIELGLHLAGDFRTVCYVEKDKYCQQVLQARMRDGMLNEAPIWDDLREFDGRPWRGVVDIVADGFPCHPFSVAGRQRGADDARNLWPDVARVIGEVAPGIVFLENVPAILPYYFHEIKPRLQGLGYSVADGIFSAAEVGATHLRQRLFVMADAIERAGERSVTQSTERALSGRYGERGHDVADTFGGRTLQASPSGADGTERDATTGTGSTVGDTDGAGLPQPGNAGGPCKAEGGIAARATVDGGSELPLWPPSPTDTDAWARVIERWPELAPAIPSIRGVANGLAHRVERLRACGNGVVPAVAYKAWITLGGMNGLD